LMPMSVQNIPGTYLPLRNKRNHYQVDRNLQRSYSYSGIKGNSPFDGTRTTAYAPGDAPAPINLYGRQKLESERGVRAIPAMARVEGLSMLFLGPLDLTGSIGRMGEWDHAEAKALMQQAERATLDSWARERAETVVRANRSLKNDSPWAKNLKKEDDAIVDLPEEQNKSKRFVVSAKPGAVTFVEAGVEFMRPAKNWEPLTEKSQLETGDNCGLVLKRLLN